MQTQHGSANSKVVRYEQLGGFVEERRRSEVLMAELTADGWEIVD